MSTWLRVRFECPVEDYRPIRWKPPGPYWCSGYVCKDEGDTPILVAYVKKEEQIKEYWPEAQNIDIMDRCKEITFTSRFPKPEWWIEDE